MTCFAAGRANGGLIILLERLTLPGSFSPISLYWSTRESGPSLHAVMLELLGHLGASIRSNASSQLQSLIKSLQKLVLGIIGEVMRGGGGIIIIPPISFRVISRFRLNFNFLWSTHIRTYMSACVHIMLFSYLPYTFSRRHLGSRALNSEAADHLSKAVTDPQK